MPRSYREFSLLYCSKLSRDSANLSDSSIWSCCFLFVACSFRVTSASILPHCWGESFFQALSSGSLLDFRGLQFCHTLFSWLEAIWAGRKHRNRDRFYSYFRFKLHCPHREWTAFQVVEASLLGPRPCFYPPPPPPWKYRIRDRTSSCICRCLITHYIN